MTEDIDSALRLAGYVRLAENGFALPAWGIGPGANVWYSAIPTIEGDHSSTIATFELLENEQIIPLAGATVLAVPGAPWQDVFLWNGEVFAGTPREIFAALAPHAADILRLAPLSYLDLALAADAPDTVSFAKEARAFLQRRVAGVRGTSAFCNLVLRPVTLVALRRLEHLSGGAGEASALASEISVREVGTNLFEVSMPPGAAQALGGQAAADRLGTAIAALGDQLGVFLRTHYQDGEVRRSEKETLAPTPFVDGPVKPTALSFPEIDALRIGVVALDRRAQQIAQYLDTRSSRKKAGENERSSSHRKGDHDTATSHTVVMEVINSLSLLEASAAYDVVICLVSNELLREADTLERLTSLEGVIHQNTPFLLAPAPPADGPSLLLDGAGRANDLLDRCSAVVDTTLARSPYWTGHQRRSIDRRMADIIAAIGTAAVADRRLLRQLLTPTEAGLRVLSMNFEGVIGSDISAISELSAPSRGALIARIDTFVRDLSDEKSRSVTIELRTFGQDFRQLVDAAISEIAGRHLTANGDELPESVREVLDVPSQAVAVRLATGREKFVVVTAETPDLATLRAARHIGAAVVRYTDRQALRALLERDDSCALPLEIRLPPLQRYARNRGLATRGVDARDIVRVSYNQWADLRSSSGASVLLKEARRYRSALRSGTEDEMIAIPMPAILNAANAGDALAKNLIERATPSRQNPNAIAGKRISDLATAWSRPFGDQRRWVIEDGVVPVEIAALSADEVPAQRLFLIDGDEAVPVLLLSRLFAVWARALLPSSTSWSSRFQVGQTFDAFPFTLSFVVTPARGGSPPQLQFSRQSDSFVDLMNLLGLDSGGFKSPTSDPRHIEVLLHDDSVMRDVNAVLLTDIGLDPDADDLDILERMIERNRLHQ
ncbi:hypothetical protein V5F59_11310 [Xanthobacter autotrophicus DSM 431]|uniref:hypothetical protein n=1 Tax=Xanthobacter nonsaccharivorans TaxID=3119912 RepID=UPI00372BF124